MDQQTEIDLLPPKALERRSRILKSPEGKCNKKNNPVLLPEVREPYRGQFVRLFSEPLPDLEFGLGTNLMGERLEKGLKSSDSQDLYLPKSITKLIGLVYGILNPPDETSNEIRFFRPSVFIWGSKEAGFPDGYPGKDSSEIGLIKADLACTSERTKEKERYSFMIFPYRMRAYTAVRGQLSKSIEGCDPVVAKEILTRKRMSPEVVSEIISSLEEEDPYIALLNNKCGYRVSLDSSGSLRFNLWINDVHFSVSEDDDPVLLKGETYRAELLEPGDKYGLDKRKAALERKLHCSVSYDEPFRDLCLGVACGLSGFKNVIDSTLENYEER